MMLRRRNSCKENTVGELQKSTHGDWRLKWICAAILLIGNDVCSASFVTTAVPGLQFGVPQQRRRQFRFLLPWPNSSTGSCRTPSFSFLQQSQMDDIEYDGLFAEEASLTRDEIQSLTVPQIKQQLRLHGLRVSGRKQDLIDRLLAAETSSSTNEFADDVSNAWDQADTTPDPQDASESPKEQSTGYSTAREFAEANGKELVDITDYLDEEDKGRSVKSFGPTSSPMEEDYGGSASESSGRRSGTGAEVWGSEAKIVEDYEGRSPVVDSLSRTVVEFLGSNQTMAQAYVVASRDALKPFLSGGANSTRDPKQQVREIQMKREMAAKRPKRLDDVDGPDEGDENKLYANILERDYSDWGEYSLTGAQISAQEVQGVLLLSDVYGAFSDDTKALAEKIAFECQPVVVMVPDLFRGKPWKENPTTPGFNDENEDYENWRAHHSDVRVSVDIRAAAACLRERYGVSSIVLMGTCYGGGRALEAAAGHLPGGSIYDIDGSVGPAPVDPSVAVAWYPTRYDARRLFGPDRKAGKGRKRRMAVMAVFAGNDVLPGATSDDAAELKELLGEDDRIKDYMVKVFPDQEHGFAHVGLSLAQQGAELDRFVDDEFGAGRVSMDDSDREVACLLSTAFMETYSRMFLPTTGPAIMEDSDANSWNSMLEMADGNDRTADIRSEIEESIANFEGVPLGGIHLDPSRSDHQDKLKEVLRQMEPEGTTGPLKILEDDDIETIYAKLSAGDDSFQLF